MYVKDSKGKGELPEIEALQVDEFLAGELGLRELFDIDLLLGDEILEVSPVNGSIEPQHIRGVFVVLKLNLVDVNLLLEVRVSGFDLQFVLLIVELDTFFATGSDLRLIHIIRS